MRKTVFALAAFAFSLPALAQQELPLYPSGRVPFNLPNAAKEHPKPTVSAEGFESAIGLPTLSYYPPSAQANRGAVLICPGGGYGILSARGEGSEVAQYFNKLGYAAFVLHYRLPDSTLVENRNRMWVPLGDAIQAMSIIKQNAQGLGIDTGRIGAIGFSAGGHLVGSLATIPERHPFGSAAAKPAWVAMIYPVATFYGGHPGTRRALLGGNGRIRPETDSLFSPALQVSARTPPTFMVHSLNDEAVPYRGSVLYAENLAARGGNAELHLYPTGGHGYGLHGPGSAADWPRALEAWLKGK